MLHRQASRLYGILGTSSIPTSSWRSKKSKASAIAALFVPMLALLPSNAAWASASIIGSGSSFAAPEISSWTSAVAISPYNLTVNFTSSSSGEGRFEFANKSVDFAVSDIPYQAKNDTPPPSNWSFIYIPVTAGGLSFMYHLNGLSKTLQLSSYSACAIFTGAVAYWDDPIIKADNPGLNLPHLPVVPVTRSDLAGTNFVFQEYCIHEQPQLWQSFIKSVTGLQNQVTDLSATQPRSDWPLLATRSDPVSGSTTAADTVASSQNDGYITAVETAYAIQHHMPTASVKNASGDYTQPTSANVDSALAYATQQADGTHVLDFEGAGPNVYNPSTYSYVLTPTTGWSADKGATLDAFINYALTIGQQIAPSIGYAPLGLSLERFGINSAKLAVPGAVGLTSLEQNGFQCGDLTVQEVQAGQTKPTCGVTNQTAAPIVNANAVSSPSVASGSSANSTSGSSSSPGGGADASVGLGGTTSSGGGSGASPVDPSVSLGTSAPSLSFTGSNTGPIVLIGLALALLGIVGRRKVSRINRATTREAVDA